MKNRFVILLAFIWVISMTGSAFAAKPFADVPARHWSYDAVSKLAAEGILEGEGNGAFQGDKLLTRYEFAVLVSKALAKEEKATQEQKVLIYKLTEEYKQELEGLGVRVKALEDKADALQFTGTARFRADAQANGDTYDDKHVNLDLHFTYKVNPDWSMIVENEYQRKFTDPSAGDSAGDNAISDNSAINSQTEQLYATGPIAGASVKVGRYTCKPAYGLVFDSRVVGMEATFGKVVKTTLSASNTDAADGYKGVEAAWSVSPDTKVKADYQQIDVNGALNKYYTVGFDTQAAKEVAFTVAVAKSDKESNNKAYFAQLQYDEANSKDVGSSDWFINYRKTPTNAVYYTDMDSEDRILDINFKGVRVGVDYVPMLNSKLTAWYMSGKDADTGRSEKKVYRGQI
ncbi:MAG: S-layer protein, partial [Firmicutes bacterium]|nr:S-layer protein [Bacillota bacterium]